MTPRIFHTNFFNFSCGVLGGLMACFSLAAYTGQAKQQEYDKAGMDRLVAELAMELDRDDWGSVLGECNKRKECRDAVRYAEGTSRRQ